MHEPEKSRLGWLVMVGVYWVFQALYLVSPVDLVPDVVPIVGFADDLLGILGGLLVTAFGLYKAFGDRLALPTSEARSALADAIDTTAEPVVPAEFAGYTPRREHAEYKPLTPEELKAL
jgi:hypothetical protein